jgi:hypothetical protein
MVSRGLHRLQAALATPDDAPQRNLLRAENAPAPLVASLVVSEIMLSLLKLTAVMSRCGAVVPSHRSKIGSSSLMSVTKYVPLLLVTRTPQRDGFDVENERVGLSIDGSDGAESVHVPARREELASSSER